MPLSSNFLFLFLVILSRFVSHKPILYLKTKVERQILFSTLVWWDLQNGKSTKYLKCVQKIFGIDVGDSLSGLPKALKLKVSCPRKGEIWKNFSFAPIHYFIHVFSSIFIESSNPKARIWCDRTSRNYRKTYFFILLNLYLKTRIYQNVHSMLPAHKLGYNQKTSDVDKRTNSWCDIIRSGETHKVNKQCSYPLLYSINILC